MSKLNKYITKSELSESLSGEVDLPVFTTKKLVSAFFDEITKTVKQKGSAEFRGFGSFTYRALPPRASRNPKTGEEIHLLHRGTMHFKAAQPLKEKINRHKND